MKTTILILTVFAIALNQATAQNTGINTTTPQAYLDINGDMALRIGVINLPNTANADVNTTTSRKSIYRVTISAASAASISGFTGGVDGRTITLMNTAALPMSLINDGVGNASTAANRILTSDGNTLSIPTNGAVTLMYDATASRWRVSNFSKPDAVAGSNSWATFGNDIYNANAGSVGIGGNTTGNSDLSKLFITTANNGVGLIHTNGTIKLGTILGDRIGGTPAQDGGWIGTRTNHPLMLMTNDIEAMKIKTNGVVQIGYNANSQYTLKGHDWAMLDVFERPGGTGNTLAAFGKVNGLSIQANPATIGFNEYNDPSTPSHTTKIMTTGNAARNAFDADYGRLDWETFSYGNGSDIAAGTAQKIMSLSTAVAGVAGGGFQSEDNRLSVYTTATVYGSGTSSKYGFIHKQGSTAIGTKIDPTSNGSATARFGTQTNNDLAFFTNDNAANAMTISTLGNVGIGGYPTANSTRLYIKGNASSNIIEANTSLVSMTLQNIGDTAGGIGTATSHDFSIFAYNHLSQFTAKTNGDLEMAVANNANVRIGSSVPSSYKLAVNGNILSKEIVVQSAWADYVFDENYRVPELKDVEKFIGQNKHLPGIPSATDIETNGLKVGDVQTKMMAKIEELTLYIISLNKKIEALESKVNSTK